MCLLASMMLDRDVLDAIRAVVTRDDFFQTDHQLIFDTLIDLRQRGAVDAVLVRQSLLDRGLLDDVGGVAYLGQILRSVPSAAHGAHYAGIIREKSKLRAVLSVCHAAERAVYAPAGDERADDLLSGTIRQLSDVLASGRASDVVSLGEVMQDVSDQLQAGGVPTVATGFDGIDRATGGIGMGELCILAARPSMGKSTLARQIARRVAGRGVPVLYVSLEESPNKIGRNLLSADATVENRRVRAGNIHADEWADISTSVDRLSALPIYIARRCRRMDDLRALVPAMKTRHGIQLLVVDYLGQLTGVKGNSLYEQTTAKSNELCALIKDEGVAGLVLAQLSRGVEQRQDKRPTMSDLRDSGAIEQDADVVLMLHREDYYHTADPDYTPTEQAEIIVCKARDGVRGEPVFLHSAMKYQRFDDIVRPDAA